MGLGRITGLFYSLCSLLVIYVLAYRNKKIDCLGCKLLDDNYSRLLYNFAVIVAIDLERK